MIVFKIKGNASSHNIKCFRYDQQSDRNVEHSLQSNMSGIYLQEYIMLYYYRFYQWLFLDVLTFNAWLKLDPMDFLHKPSVRPWSLHNKCQRVMLVYTHALHRDAITMPQSLFWWMWSARKSTTVRIYCFVLWQWPIDHVLNVHFGSFILFIIILFLLHSDAYPGLFLLCSRNHPHADGHGLHILVSRCSFHHENMRVTAVGETVGKTGKKVAHLDLRDMLLINRIHSGFYRQRIHNTTVTTTTPFVHEKQILFIIQYIHISGLVNIYEVCLFNILSFPYLGWQSIVLL